MASVVVGSTFLPDIHSEANDQVIAMTLHVWLWHAWHAKRKEYSVAPCVDSLRRLPGTKLAGKHVITRRFSLQHHSRNSFFSPLPDLFQSNHPRILVESFRLESWSNIQKQSCSQKSSWRIIVAMTKMKVFAMAPRLLTTNTLTSHEYKAPAAAYIGTRGKFT